MSETASEATSAEAVGLREERSRLAYPVMLFVALWMAALRGLHFEDLGSGFGLVDNYWVSFYLMSYADGFRRRALVGSLFRLIQPNGAHVLLINVITILVLVSLLAVLVRALMRVTSNRSPISLCLIFAFCISSLVCVYFEVLGDMLQMCLVLVALVGSIALRQRSPTLPIAFGYGLLLMCFFIHEASIFFVAPCLPFLFHRWPRWQDFMLPAIAVVILLGVSVAWSNVHASLTYRVILLRHTADPNLSVDTPPFRALLRDLYVVKFGGLRGEVKLASKIFRIGLVAFAGLVALANVIRWTGLRRLVFAFSTICIFSIPLWVIGEDWGRFLAYSLLLATLITSWCYRFPPSHSDLALPLPTDRLSSLLQRLGSYSFVRLAAIMILILSPFHDSRMLGITMKSTALCLGLIAAAIAEVLGWIPALYIDAGKADLA
jgi:hypothetical protein